MLGQYKELCTNEVGVTRYQHALRGMWRGSLEETWIAHHGKAGETLNIHPPYRCKGTVNKLEYSAPSKDFVAMATDAMQVLEFF